jgi:DeoR family ulaG and ulaABCDEF operon transcriptional repressor
MINPAQPGAAVTMATRRRRCDSKERLVMHERERWRAILAALDTKPVVTVRHLQARLKSSSATIRRDLSQLEQLGKLRRVHGGAEAIDRGRPQQLVGQQAFEQSRTLNAAQKRAIARRAAELCADGEPIIVDGGSTTYMMVEFLRDRPLQVLTSSFPIADALFRGGRARVIVPGGEIYREQNLILSPFADGVLQSFRASKVFMGAQAIRAQGLMQSDPLLVQAEQRLMDQAERLVVLVDSSKFQQVAGLILCPLKRIDTLITDTGAPRAALDMLKSAGVRVELVEPDESPGGTSEPPGPHE